MEDYLSWSSDLRIKFVRTVYNGGILYAVRCNTYADIHGYSYSLLFFKKE
jgi:hypothetical protein